MKAPIELMFMRPGRHALFVGTHPYLLLKVIVGIVSELCHMPPETLGEHRELRGSVNTHGCRGKSLIGSALVGFGVRQHARGDSIFKRAPSTTRTSLRFRINALQAVCI